MHHAKENLRRVRSDVFADTKKGTQGVCLLTREKGVDMFSRVVLEVRSRFIAHVDVTANLQGCQLMDTGKAIAETDVGSQ